MSTPIALNEPATAELIAFAADALSSGATAFEAAARIARRLGAHKRGDVCEVGIWAPELLERRVPDGDVFLEVLRHPGPLALDISRQHATFRRTLVPVSRIEGYCFAAVDGMRAGTRGQTGDFYALIWRDGDGKSHRILDPLSASLPFGAFAPAEYYDTASLQAERGDAAYWQALATEGTAKIGPSSSILQVHVPTATAGMTIASLARHIEYIAERVRSGGEPEPADRLFLGYDAIQLLPVEPTTVYEAGPAFWTELDSGAGSVAVDLRRPDTTNWGYDVVISGMAAVNPALLESGRPDELVDLAVALHTFPGRPKRLILDVVYGHADNQGLEVLPPQYFAGPNMYGQNIDYRNPTVRAILLEMQRRKVNFGADGVRVDGAQDFKWWDADAQLLRHDDEYLRQMAGVEQEVCGVRYRPWFIFEDGRPWPEEDWELSSTYRAVIDDPGQDDDVFQWGPLSFAHNTPFLYCFWLNKYWRIREILERGENWISGTANHDTLRRGTQVSQKLNINTRLGDTHMEILDKAYDNPAAQLLTYACLPGVPMDFLNACARGSWGFIRNQDDRWGVKVVAEEAISLKWQVDAYAYSQPGSFRRLKEMGFATRADLARFLEVLPALVEVTEYDLAVMAKLLNATDPPLAGPETFTVAGLKDIARAWMDDMHDYCNVAGYEPHLGDFQTRFTLALREFRLARPWLRHNLGPDDRFDYAAPLDGTVVFRSLRHGPDGSQVFAIVHMEGKPLDCEDPLTLPIEGLQGGGWEVALRTPPIGADYTGGPIVLRDSMGVVFTRSTGNTAAAT